MTDKERYKRTFSVLHAPESIIAEAEGMKKRSRSTAARFAVICAAVILVLGLASIAYAADIGGIQRHIQLWINGDQTDAVLEIQHGEHTEYTLTYTDENGVEHESGGGGIAVDIFGRERPLTEEEIMEHLNAPDVQYRDDGTVWVYCRSQCVDITDKFDENGVCYVHLVDGDKDIYMTVEYGNGYVTSGNKFPKPSAG